MRSPNCTTLTAQTCAERDARTGKLTCYGMLCCLWADCPMEKKGKTVSRKYMGFSYSSSQEVMLFLPVSSIIVSGDCVIHRIETHYHSQCFPASWRKNRPSMDELWLQNAIWYRLCHIDHIIYINLEILNKLWPLSPIFTLHLLLPFSFGFGFWVKTGVNVWENKNEERLPV